MVTKEDLLAKGFIESSGGIFVKTYQRGGIIINGVPQMDLFSLQLTLDNSDPENELGSYIQFHIDKKDKQDWVLGRTGYYHDINDLQKDIKLKL